MRLTMVCNGAAQPGLLSLFDYYVRGPLIPVVKRLMVSLKKRASSNRTKEEAMSGDVGQRGGV
jgi:hypothetical protein